MVSARFFIGELLGKIQDCHNFGFILNIRNYSDWCNSDQSINKTKKNHKHPYISDKIFADLDEELIKFKVKLEEEIKYRIEEIEDLKDNDDVIEAFEKYFEVGKKYNYEQITEIIKEGEFRYKYSIPPGYKDLDDKIGFQIFGDLIIWKQIIEYSKATNKSVIFINDDLKEDWWTLDKKNNPIAPRTELIDEIQFNSNTSFWMYSTLQFLEKSKELLGSKIKENAIIEVRNTSYKLSGLKAEEAFIKWVIETYGEIGDLVYPERSEFIGLDMILHKKSETIGFKSRFLRHGYDSHIRLRLNKTLEVIRRRGEKYNLDKIYLVIITQSSNSARKLLGELERDSNQLFLFETFDFDVDYIVGFIDDEIFTPII